MTQNPLRKLSAKDGLDSPNLLRTWIDDLPEQVYVKDTEGCYLLNNTKHVKALGAARPEEIVGKSDFDFYPKKVAERYRADEQEIVRSGKPLIDKEEPSVDGEGNKRWHSITKVPLRDESGKIVGLVGITRDVTERREAEEVLRENEDRFRSMTNAAFEGIAITENGEILEANQAFAEMFGYELSEVHGMSALEFQAPETRDEVWQKISSGYDQPYESKGLKKDGTTFDVEIRGKTTRYGGRSARVTALRDITERKEAEEKLKESERRFRSLIQNASDVITILDSDGTIRYKSPVVERVLGYGEQEMVGTSGFGYVHPDDVEEVRRTFAATLEVPGVHPPVQFRFRHADGSWRYMEAIRNNLLEDVDVQGIVVNTRDVTDRKEAEEKLERLNRQNELILNSAGEGIYGLDLQGKTTFVNQAAARLTGWDALDLIGRHQHEVMHHTKPDGTPYPSEECPIYATLEDGVVRRVTDEVFWRKDGRSFPVEYVSTPIRERGEIVGAVVVFEDVTERKRAEARLRESEERFRSAFEDAPIGLALVGLDGRRLKVNRALCEMLGYSEEELLGKDYSDVIHLEDQEVSADHLRRTLEGELGSYTLERRYVHADGHTVWNLTSVSLIQGSQGEPSHFVCLHQDITERREAEEKLKESERRFRSLIQNASDVITILDSDGTIRYESPAVERVLGYRPEERVGKTGFDHVHPDDRERVESTFAQALVEPGRVQPPVEFRLRHKDGSWHHMETTRTNLLDDPAVKGVVANSRDITDRRQAEEKLRESEERHRAVVEQSVEGIYVFDPSDGRILETNGAFEKLCGYTSEELRGMTVYDFIAHEREDVERNVRLDHEQRRRYKGERKYRRKDGSLVDVEVSASVIPYRAEEAVCCVVHDVTEHKALEERLEYQAFHDSLTDLPNRTLFLDRLGHALARAHREGGPVAVLFVDLDDFKVVNDSLGHDAGNEVLVEVAERLQESVRPGDTVGRIFGDEFAVLLEAPAGVEEARRVAERIQEGLQAPLDVNEQKVVVKCSIGISLDETAKDEPQEDQAEEMLRHADLAMYEAKNGGKARFEVYKPSMNHRAVERMDLESDLRRAVEREEFELYYQPKVLLESGTFVGVEALVRWRHPDRGLLLPDQFLPLAEETALIEQIGLWVLKESCRQLKEWQERYPAKKLDLCVNLSAKEIQQPDLAEKVADVLVKTELNPHCLVLEISEKTAMEDAEQTIGKLRELKELDVRLALDDFGTGYCSLVYLEHSLLDVLKIDRLLVHREREDPDEYASTLSAMTSMAQALGLLVVVEGVETEEQLMKVKDIGCEMAQGFYFAKPLPSEAVESLLREGVSY